MADRFEIVASRLLYAFVSSDGSIASRAGKVFAVFVRDVLSLAVLVAFGKTEIDDVDVVSSRVCATDEEVVGLDVSVNDALLMHLLYATNELHRNHQDSLEIEVPLAGLEEVFERWSKQVHHHHMELVIWH